MSAEFRSLVELALSAPIICPELIMSCVDEDRELGDLHDWSNDADSLVRAFEMQGDCLLGLRSYTELRPYKMPAGKGGFISWGAFLCMDEGIPEEMVVDYTDNKVMSEIWKAWAELIDTIPEDEYTPTDRDFY